MSGAPPRRVGRPLLPPRLCQACRRAGLGCKMRAGQDTSWSKALRKQSACTPLVFQCMCVRLVSTSWGAVVLPPHLCSGDRVVQATPCLSLGRRTDSRELVRPLVCLLPPHLSSGECVAQGQTRSVRSENEKLTFWIWVSKRKLPYEYSI